MPVDGGGSALFVGDGSECSVSFPWETFFSFCAIGGSEVVFMAVSFPWETSFPFDACVGIEMAFMVPMPAC